jgi:hypothetical protein
MNTITINLVRDESGALDVEASVAGARADILNYQANRETETATIALAVAEVFAKFPAARLNMPVVRSMTLHALNAQPENFQALGDRVLDYVRENAGEKRTDGKLFKISKGKGGGVRLWSDVPEEKPATDAK